MAKASPKREAERLQAEQRRRECLALRVGGATIAEIANLLNLSKSTVHGHIKRALDELAKADKEAAERYRALCMQRLDGLLKGIWLKATAGTDLKATREARMLVQAQARLVGAEAPMKVAVTDPTGDNERTPANWIVPMPAERNVHEWAAETAAMLAQREEKANALVADLLETGQAIANEADGE